MIVYRATNRLNGKCYIGKTVRTLSHAKARHHQRAKFGWKYGSHGHFYAAIRKYGWENFEWHVLDRGVSDEEIQDLERKWIARLGTTDPAIGYNMTPGGDGGAGKTLSEAQKEKLRQHFTGEKNPCWGRFGADHPAVGHTKTQAGREAISRATRGRVVSAATRAKLSATRIALFAEQKAARFARLERERQERRRRFKEKKAAGGFRGENAGRSKISDADRARICERRAAGESYKSIAADYPLALTAVRAILKDWGPSNGFPFKATFVRRQKGSDDSAVPEQADAQLELPGI